MIGNQAGGVSDAKNELAKLNEEIEAALEVARELRSIERAGNVDLAVAHGEASNQ